MIQNADNLVIIGSPYAMLLHSVGEDVNNDDTFYSEDGVIQCYTKRFEDNEYLAAFRSPFNSKNNMVVLPKGKLAVIDGLEGFLIAESDNVLLICRKDEEHAIRKYVNDAQMQLGDDFI